MNFANRKTVKLSETRKRSRDDRVSAACYRGPIGSGGGAGERRDTDGWEREGRRKISARVAGCVSGCSEDEAAGVANAEVGGGCTAGAPTTGSGGGGGGGTGSEAGGAGAGAGGGGGGRGSGEGGSTKQGGERCPQCGFLCRDVHVLQLHLEDTHKTSYAIDKNDLNAQFPQVVSETNVKDERTPLFACYRSCAAGFFFARSFLAVGCLLFLASLHFSRPPRVIIERNAFRTKILDLIMHTHARERVSWLSDVRRNDSSWLSLCKTVLVITPVRLRDSKRFILAINARLLRLLCFDVSTRLYYFTLVTRNLDT